MSVQLSTLYKFTDSSVLVHATSRFPAIFTDPSVLAANAHVVVHIPPISPTLLTLRGEKLEDSGFHGSESPFHLLLVPNVHRPAQGWLLRLVLELVHIQGKVSRLALAQSRVYIFAVKKYTQVGYYRQVH